MNVETVKYMIMAQDMERAVRFYGGGLGLAVGFKSPEWTELMHANGAVVALHGGWDGRPNKTGLSFQVTDIEAACAAATRAGALLLSGPADRSGEPIILADLRDPEGNEITFSQYKA